MHKGSKDNYTLCFILQIQTLFINFYLMMVTNLTYLREKFYAEVKYCISNLNRFVHPKSLILIINKIVYLFIHFKKRSNYYCHQKGLLSLSRHLSCFWCVQSKAFEAIKPFIMGLWKFPIYTWKLEFPKVLFVY